MASFSIRKTFGDIQFRYRLPGSVSVTSLPENANVYTGENLDSDALVLPIEALVPLQFSLTPFFLNFFDFIQISPLQLAPSAYRILASCKAVSRLSSGGYLSLLVVFHFYKLVEDGHYYCLHPRFDKDIFINHDYHDHARWGEMVVLISGHWFISSEDSITLPIQLFACSLVAHPYWIAPNGSEMKPVLKNFQSDKNCWDANVYSHFSVATMMTKRNVIRSMFVSITNFDM
ncbi:hypothetical protein TIFTF001_022998 [Ficus carica]|uniref:Uncharacterized protein n=1 Tax=Ficus carica TaxID=3494 RepID=A0AA88AMU2_FICCA|nr:hypothetical protein TIFTF001_022998 [Ficus carica]